MFCLVTGNRFLEIEGAKDLRVHDISEIVDSVLGILAFG